MKRGKKYQDAVKNFDKAAQYDVAEAISLVKKNATAKFDETIELHIRTGCDGRHAEQQIRGAVVLPHGTGKTVKVLVFAKGTKLDEAQAAGADYVGGEELIPKIQNEGWLDFDVVVATPDMMGVVGRLGRVLGPKGLMPNPKAGTVTMDVTKAVNDIKAGKIEYRLDKTNIIHVPVGKASFTEEQLRKAIHDSALENDLLSMPNGLDTLVGEGGCNISGGQKQRVAIARALIHERSILLVDEGTSALDAQNADLVEKSLLANPNLTLILISHHLSDKRKAQFDCVYELMPTSSRA